MKKLVLVEGNALLHRAYHATPPLTTSKGELVNAVYGFTSLLLKALQELKPDFIIIAWDKKGPTFRHQAYTQYKATRGPADDGLSGQYPRVFEVTAALNIPEFGLDGYEADDLIGTLAQQAIKKESDLEVVVLTGDRDIMQIISDRVKVLMPKKTLSDVGLYGIVEFRDKYGFEQLQMIEYKALAGAASDNIPGVPGVGDVTATKLIKQFGNIEKIYDPKNLTTLPERTRLLLSVGAESAVMSKKLATLDLEAPIKLDLAKCRTHDFDRQKVVDLFEELEFKTLTARIPRNSGPKEQNDPRPTTNVPHFATSQSQGTIDLDLEVTPVLQKMSETGIMVDLECLNKLGESLKARLANLEKEIYDTIGHEFNINSPKQLGGVLFDELHLPVIKKTKTGRSTDEATLHELTGAHPVIKLLLEYRQLFKMVSTYIDTLPKFIKQDGRVHSTFNVEGAATGRLSSQDPNLQNIPIKGEGAQIRKAFVAPRGKVLLGADYSQIELRIMAHLADDPGLKKAFLEGQDIHATTASKIFDTPIDQINKQSRMVGKTMNFATLYGQGPRALSKQLGVDMATAKQYIEDYFNEFSKVREWMQQTLAKAYQQGYVETISCRRRYIPELQASNKAIQAFGERAAINHPIQGTSADMIKIAMVEISKELSVVSRQSSESRIADSKAGLKTESCQLILQVHDELLFECNENSLQDLAKLVKEKMENALKLSVPVIVDLKTGPNWGEMIPLKGERT